MIKTTNIGRLLAGGLLALTVGACSFDEVLSVQNPDQIPEDALANEKFANVLVSSVKGDLAAALDDPFIWRGSMFTDETLTGINWEQTARLNERIVQFDEGDADLMFTQLSRFRAQADSVSGRLKGWGIGGDRLATTLAYAGYSYIFLADAMCEATVQGGSQLIQPTELYTLATTRLEEALTQAQDQDLIYLIHVGLSRAYLNLGDAAKVNQYAAPVPEDFRWYAEYVQPEVENVLAGRTQGGNHSLSVHPKFLADSAAYGTDEDLTPKLTDPRVQHDPEWRYGHNRLTKIYTPFAPLMWDTYNGETIAAGGSPSDLRTTENDGADIAFASGLEAKHNMMEVSTDLNAVKAFVDARRAFGNQTGTYPATTLDEVKAELRNQRGRDLFLAGYRLGDLRRWDRLGVGDFFPSGQHPVTEWGDYGTAKCFPVPLEEYEGNPNLPLPGS